MEDESKRTVFVLMPFSEQFHDVYDLGIKAACTEAGAQCERVDEKFFSDQVHDRITKDIAHADIVIADLTGCNPNVSYEVGFAHALKKEHVILIAQKPCELPFDLQNYPCLLYEIGRLRRLKEELGKRIRWCVRSLQREPAAMRKVFGDSVAGGANVPITLPIFMPLIGGVVKEEQAETWMRKGGTKVPMLSPTIVLEDYRAYKEVSDLFSAEGLGPLKLVRDDTDSDIWGSEESVICIAGPRSNRFTREALDFEDCRQFVQVRQGLDDWELEVLKPRSLVLRPTEEMSLAVILRLRNRRLDPNGVAVLAFGNGANQTLAAARYVRREYRKLAEMVSSVELLAVVSVADDASEYEKLIYAASPDEEFVKDERKLKHYRM